MPQPMLILLDYMEKAITDLNSTIARGSLTKTRVAFEKLTGFSNYLKELLPEEFIEENFEAFDRHMGYIEYWLKKKDFDWIRDNFDDIQEKDFPNIKKKIYDLPEEEKTPKRIVSSKVFIVHGRNHEPMKKLKSMLSELGLNPIVLHEQPSGSRTIVEKLEKYSDVGYAFVILTPDDVGAPKGRFYNKLRKIGVLDVKDVNERARQNVVLEFGYFMGRLGRDRVCCLYKGDVELPSDMHGIVYIPFKDAIEEARSMIVKELKEVGYKIKL